MAFQVLDRRITYRTKEIAYSDTVGGTYVLTQEDYAYWLKVDTSLGQINLSLPSDLQSGYYNIVENVGPYYVMFVTDAGQTLQATHNYIGVTNCTGHVFYEGDNMWRLQGALGNLDSSSLTDVVIPVGARQDRSVMTYNQTVDKIILSSGVPRRFHRFEYNNYTTANNDFGYVLLFDSTSAGSDITVYLEDGLEFLIDYNITFHNLGPHNVLITTSGLILGSSSTTIPVNGRVEAELVDTGKWVIWGDLV
jgi:hypothetical protein